MRPDARAEACDETRLLLQAELDGELDAARAAGLAGHLADCDGCTAAREQLTALSAALRRSIPYHAAPDDLRETLRRRLSVQAAPPPARRAASRWRTLVWRWRGAAAFGSSAAAMAAVALLVPLPGRGDFSEYVISDHIHALQPGHLTDVPSTDQHTVKPWFDGRLDFSPPVKELATQGFPLIGGRLEYIDGHSAAALVYRRARHVIDLYVWLARGRDATAPVRGERNGYSFIRWRQNGMAFWAVSDVEVEAACCVRPRVARAAVRGARRHCLCRWNSAAALGAFRIRGPTARQLATLSDHPNAPMPMSTKWSRSIILFTQDVRPIPANAVGAIPAGALTEQGITSGGAYSVTPDFGFFVSYLDGHRLRRTAST